MKGPGHRLSAKKSEDIPSNKMNGSDKQNSGPRTFESTKKGKTYTPAILPLF